MRTLGGLLYVFLAGLVAVLWIRGYLTAGIAKITAAIQNPPAPRPFTIGGSLPGGRVNPLPGGAPAPF